MTIKYQGADRVSGACTLTTLPPVFTQNVMTTPGAGKYKVEASATGYTARSVAIQSSVNFTPVP